MASADRRPGKPSGLNNNRKQRNNSSAKEEREREKKVENNQSADDWGEIDHESERTFNQVRGREREGEKMQRLSSWEPLHSAENEECRLVVFLRATSGFLFLLFLYISHLSFLRLFSLLSFILVFLFIIKHTHTREAPRRSMQLQE